MKDRTGPGGLHLWDRQEQDRGCLCAIFSGPDGQKNEVGG